MVGMLMIAYVVFGGMLAVPDARTARVSVVWAMGIIGTF